MNASAANYNSAAVPARVAATLGRRGSNAAGRHQTGTRRRRDRGAANRAAISDSSAK